MLLIAAFLRATALIVAGYFVWFAASKAAEDRLKTAGKIIAGWCAVFAVVLVIAGITSAFMHPGFRGRGPGIGPGFGPGMMRGGPMHGQMMQGQMMRGQMMRGDMGPRFLYRERMPAADTTAPKAETPAATANPKP